jgi:hypothetical protein
MGEACTRERDPREDYICSSTPLLPTQNNHTCICENGILSRINLQDEKMHAYSGVVSPQCGGGRIILS